MAVGTTTPCMPVAMPLPVTTVRDPGDMPGWKLAAFKKTTPVGPGSRDESENDAVNAPEVASTVMAPEFGPACTVVEAWPLASVVASGVPTLALPLVTANDTEAPENP